MATYKYRNAEGAVGYEAVRFEPKDFMPQYPDAGGRMVAGLPESIARVWYRLPELAAYSGESDHPVRSFRSPVMG